jgi:hypothetical protein
VINGAGYSCRFISAKLNIRDLANNQTVTVQIVDYFPENKHAGPKDVGIPDFEFVKFAPLKDGIVPNAQWEIV